MNAKLGVLGRKLRALFRRAQLERDLDEEIAFHRAMMAERGDGRRFGNATRLREQAREQWMLAWLESWRQDASFAWRSLRSAPGFCLAVALTLALGIGGNSAIFSLSYGVLWKPLPYPAAERIVRVRQGRLAAEQFMNSGLDIAEARGAHVGLTDWSMFRASDATLTGAGEPELLAGVKSEAGALRVLGVKPELGRLLGPADDGVGAAPVVMIGDQLWHQRWGGRADVVGRTILLQGKPYTVVGVLPANFQFLSEPTVLLFPWAEPIEGQGNRDVDAIARLAPGVTMAQAQERLETEMTRLAAVHQADNGWRFVLTPLRQSMTLSAQPALLALLAAVCLLTLIAGANVACLLLARGQRRRRELATRVALGAGRARLLRQLLTETALLVATGGAAGLGAAAGGIDWLRHEAPRDIPRLGEVGLNGEVIAFTALLALLIGHAFGLGPALAASGKKIEAALRSGPAAPAGERSHARGAWVVAQIALSLVLLMGAGLLLKAFDRMMSVPLGFNPAQTLTFDLSLPASRYPTPAARWRFVQSVRERLAAEPGVTAAAMATTLPLQGGIITDYGIPDHPLAPHDDSRQTGLNPVDANYLAAMQIPLLAGRGIDPGDTANAPPVAVVSQALARAAFGDANPVGQRIEASWGATQWMTVVGVAGDVQGNFGEKPAPPAPMLYVPLAQRKFIGDEMTFIARSAGAPSGVFDEARGAVAGVDADMPLAFGRSMGEIYGKALAYPRFRGYLLAAFAALALLLSGVGVYGLLAYSVGGRTREFGLRAALGAQRWQVLAIVLRQTLWLTALGLALGLAAALPLTRLLRRELYGVSPADPWVIALTLALLLAVALVAAWVPGRRAMRIDPAQALRSE